MKKKEEDFVLVTMESRCVLFSVIKRSHDIRYPATRSKLKGPDGPTLWRRIQERGEEEEEKKGKERPPLLFKVAVYIL